MRWLIPLLVACAEAPPEEPPPEDAAPWATVAADEAMLDAVRAELSHAWQGYATHAFGADEVRPVSQQPANWHPTSMGLTIVDAWDTLHLAGLTTEADAALTWIHDELELDLDQYVSAFETNIRALGGLLSVHAHTGDAEALALAVDLADRLLPAFDTPTGMPRKFVNLRTGDTDVSIDVDAAEIGTWVIELGYLSRVTGDERYVEAALRAHRALDDRRTPEAGLLPSGWNVDTGEPTLSIAQLGGGVDSAYEYLLKGAILLDDAELQGRYDDAMAAANEHLAETTDDGLWYGAADARYPDPLLPFTGALACFLPGMLALDGDLDRGIASAEACFATWERLGPLPDAFDYRSSAVITGNHELRPELAESLFVLYRRTGDPVWRERGEVLLADLIDCCRVDGGYTILSDVRTGAQGDAMPSYFLAETLKYLYLLYTDDSVVDLADWVFNTEAHPFPISP